MTTNLMELNTLLIRVLEGGHIHEIELMNDICAALDNVPEHIKERERTNANFKEEAT